MNHFDDPLPAVKADLPSGLELKHPGLNGIKSMVPARSDVFSRYELRATLSDNDHSRLNGLTAKNFDSQSLGARIPCIAGCFFGSFLGHNKNNALIIVYLKLFV